MVKKKQSDNDWSRGFFFLIMQTCFYKGLNSFGQIWKMPNAKLMDAFLPFLLWSVPRSCCPTPPKKKHKKQFHCTNKSKLIEAVYCLLWRWLRQTTGLNLWAMAGTTWWTFWICHFPPRGLKESMPTWRWDAHHASLRQYSQTQKSFTEQRSFW